jgi:pantetheine-phosphate adenylyltransferase
MKPRRSIYAGSFDPFTLGHEDVVRDALDVHGFDVIVIGIAVNTAKKPLFTQEERLSIIDAVVQANDWVDRVIVTPSSGLTVELAKNYDATSLIRSFRMSTDFEYELDMSYTNRLIASEIGTIFVAPAQNHTHIMSSKVREFIRFGRLDLVEDYMPKAAFDAMLKLAPRFGQDEWGRSAEGAIESF